MSSDVAVEPEAESSDSRLAMSRPRASVSLCIRMTSCAVLRSSWISSDCASSDAFSAVASSVRALAPGSRPSCWLAAASAAGMSSFVSLLKLTSTGRSFLRSLI